MPDKFTYRSYEKELIDEPDILRDLLFKNLRELDILNKTSGGHTLSVNGIKQLLTDPHKIHHIVDLGCGGGGTLRAIAGWARLNDIKVKLTGVDRNPNAIEYLVKNCVDYPEINGIKADYQEYIARNEFIDIVHCSLFCHHLKDDELLSLFIYFRKHVQAGFVINDLQRHWLAYYSAWIFTRLFNGTPLAKNDGPVSVLRGFKSGELVSLLNQASIGNYSIRKAGAFRFLIIGNTGNHGIGE